LLEQLKEFAEYGPDWDGYGARVISPLALAAAAEFLQDEALAGIAPVYQGLVEPRHGGGLRLAWATTDPEAEDDAYVEITIDPEGVLNWLGVKGTETEEMQLSGAEAVARTVQALKNP